MSWPWRRGDAPSRHPRRAPRCVVVAASCGLAVASLPALTAGPADATTPTTPSSPSTTVPGTTPADVAIVAQASQAVHAPLPALPAVARQYTEGVDPAVLLAKAFTLLQAGSKTASLNESLSGLQATMAADDVTATQAATRAQAADAEAARQLTLSQEQSANADSLSHALRQAALSLYMTGRPSPLPLPKADADADAVVDALVGEQVALSPSGLLAAERRAASGAVQAAAKAVAAKDAADAAAAQAAQAKQAVTAQVAVMQDELSSLKGADATTLEAESTTLSQQAGKDLTTGSGLQFTPSQPIPAPVATTEAALTWAFSELGKPYVWGGTGPNVFDCSGLTQYSWAHAGVAIPRVALAQYDYTIPVPLSQLRPGDLVFFGTDVHHVGMYIGGGYMINAPYTGTVVQISSIWWSDLIGFGRVHSAGVPVPTHSTANGTPADVQASIGDVPSQSGSNPSTIVEPSTTTTTVPSTTTTTTPSSTTTTVPSTTTTTVPSTTSTTRGGLFG